MPKLPTKVSGVYGNLTVIHCNLPPRNRVLVKCRCGAEFATNSYSLINERTQSCGKTKCSTKYINLTDKKIGYLIVNELSDKKNNRNELLWICTCICKKKILVKSYHLVKELVKSCGCMKNALLIKRLKRPKKIVATNCLYATYKVGAKNRGFNFNLSKRLFKKLIFNNCYYCGSKPQATYVIRNVYETRTVKYNGVDRKNPKIGYMAENCVTCCKKCNVAKSNYSLDEFLDWAKKLGNFQNKIN